MKKYGAQCPEMLVWDCPVLFPAGYMGADGRSVPKWPSGIVWCRYRPATWAQCPEMAVWDCPVMFPAGFMGTVFRNDCTGLSSVVPVGYMGAVSRNGSTG